MSIVNLHIYPSPFKYETRILKEVKSIIDLNLASQIIIVSSSEKNQVREENISDNMKVYRLKTMLSSLPNLKFFKMLAYIEFYVRTILFGLHRKIDVVNCHSLMVLPIGVIFKVLKKTKLIYDPHELETERLGLKGLNQQVSKWIERKLIYHSDAIIVVGESIRKWYELTYKLTNIYTLKNIPNQKPATKSTVFRRTFNIPDDHMIFIYQGLLVEGRNIALYINTFKKLGKNKHLIIMGYGPLEPWVKNVSGEFSNIHFHSAVAPSEILDYTCSADVGLCLIENCCLSYYFSLPNKFFEYIMADIPVIASNFPDMASVIEPNEIGWTTEISEVNLLGIIEQTTNEKLHKTIENIKRFKAENKFSWENEALVLKEVFKKIYHNSLPNAFQE